VSAGPIKTVAARGISGFSKILQVYPERAPLRRNVDVAEVAESAAFLLSDAGRAITGEVLLVDAGYHVHRHVIARVVRPASSQPLGPHGERVTGIASETSIDLTDAVT
jgi:hypothetical protein